MVPVMFNYPELDGRRSMDDHTGDVVEARMYIDCHSRCVLFAKTQWQPLTLFPVGIVGKKWIVTVWIFVEVNTDIRWRAVIVPPHFWRFGLGNSTGIFEANYSQLLYESDLRISGNE